MVNFNNVQIIWLLLLRLIPTGDGFVQRSTYLRVRGKNDLESFQSIPVRCCLYASQSNHKDPSSIQVLLLDIDEDHDDLPRMIQSLRMRNFGRISLQTQSQQYKPQSDCSVSYRFNKASGMLQLQSKPENIDDDVDVPRWIPIVSDVESVLITNGWSFLDPDESEPMSAFDVDAANLEGTYKPKWGQDGDNEQTDMYLSLLGFDISPMTLTEVSQASSQTSDNSRKVLLEGGTDPPSLKNTNNSVDFSGSTGQSDIDRGVFFCAIGGLPLFSSVDLSPTTASSGWLSFSRPISDDHVIFVQPEETSMDQRVEVICAKSRCHLGHYFGKSEGYCINASALNFVKKESTSQQESVMFSTPISWRSFEDKILPPSQIILREICLQGVVEPRRVVFGAGCFWHVEAALRRLPGVIDTKGGYAGGILSEPTYEDVCKGGSGHAEVVSVLFDTTILSPKILIDAFLSLHDPTKVRAHGKHSIGTGQYRSCIFTSDSYLYDLANGAIEECRVQLQKELSTEIRVMTDDFQWFWEAEERHQRHDEQKGRTAIETLSFTDWLTTYGHRSASRLGSSESMEVTR